MMPRKFREDGHIDAGVHRGLAERHTILQANQVTAHAVDPQQEPRRQFQLGRRLLPYRPLADGECHGLDCFPGQRPGLAGLGVVGRGPQHALGQFDHLTPAGRAGSA